MNDLPAQHYLKIFQLRLSMAERGITSPSADVVVSMRQLVAQLAAIDPATSVKLEIHGSQARYMKEETGAIIGTINLWEESNDLS